jgi:hypothetical protein
MRQADDSLLTTHSQNLATVLRHALRLAELAGVWPAGGQHRGCGAGSIGGARA